MADLRAVEPEDEFEREREEGIWEDGHRAGIRFERAHAKRQSDGSFWLGFAAGIITGLLCLAMGLVVGSLTL